jgi:hypothetical protein
VMYWHCLCEKTRRGGVSATAPGKSRSGREEAWRSTAEESAPELMAARGRDGEAARVSESLGSSRWARAAGRDTTPRLLGRA